ncbi:MAG: sigma-70 family RNA polymerase sigma factor [Chloroflexota bacterium]
MGEAELIAASQKGEIGAFNQLVLAHEQVVYNLAYRMVSDPDAAADIAQDAFMSAFQAIRSFRGGSFKSWLLRITVNACYDYHRRRKRRPTDSLDQMQEALCSDSVFIDHSDGPEDVALQREMLEYIQQGLARLPEEQRLVVILSDVQGLSYEEIAEVTRSSLGTVKSRLSRGRAHLRDFLLRQRELLPSSLRPKIRLAASTADGTVDEEEGGLQ